MAQNWWEAAPPVAGGWQAAPAVEDPNAGMVSDLPGGGWNQDAANQGALDSLRANAETGYQSGLDSLRAGPSGEMYQSTPEGRHIAGGLASATMTGLAPFIPGIGGTLAALGGRGVGAAEGASWGGQKGADLIGGAYGKPIGQAIGGTVGFFSPEVLGRMGRAMGLLRAAAPAAEGAAVALPTAVASAKAAATAEAATVGGILPGAQKAAGGKLFEWAKTGGWFEVPGAVTEVPAALPSVGSYGAPWTGADTLLAASKAAAAARNAAPSAVSGQAGVLGAAAPDAAAGVRAAWGMGGPGNLSAALQATGDPVLALRQLALTMPRAVVEREATQTFGADAAFALLQQVF